MNNTNNFQLLCVADPQRALSASLAGKNLKYFQCALDFGADPNARDDSIGISVFEQACQTAGSAAFIVECLRSGADVLQANPNGKYPIHFAASSTDPDNIRALLENSTFSIDIAYQDQTPLHLLFGIINDTNWDNVFSSIKLLIQKGADVNIPNDDNRTAVGVFVKNSKNWQKNSQHWRKIILEYCLNHADVDVDSFRKGELRNKIVDFFPGVVIPAYTMDTNLTLLISMIKSQSESKFDSALKQYRKNQTDELAWKSDLKELIKAAVQSGKLSLLMKLISDDYVFDTDSDLPDLLGRCCNYGNHDILSFLLTKVGHTTADIRWINTFPLLSLVIKEINTQKDKDKCPFFKCLKHLLNDDRIDVDKVDEKGFSALHYAVKYKVDYAVDMLLKQSAYIGALNMFKELPICEMHPDTLKNYLDSCITTNDKRPGDEDYEINIDYSCLVPPVYKTSYSENKSLPKNKVHDEMLPIVYMANSSDLKHLLVHPVISSYVFIKWLRLSLYFYINFVVCTLFFLSFTCYVVRCYGHDDVDRWIKELLRFISLLGVTYIVIREIGQMILHARMYFSSIENWMEITLICASYTVLLKELQDEQRQIMSAIVILLSAVEFTLLVGTLPILSISTHMVMLKTVSKNFLKSLILYSIVLISFAFCFYTLFNVNKTTGAKQSNSTQEDDEKEEDKFNAFADIGTALLKTVVMLTGEFEAANIKFEVNGVSYVIFALFLFFVAIVIFNLMNGLAVSDTAAIKSEAELVGLSQKVEVISKYENALKSTNTDSILPSVIFYIIPKTFLQLFPEYLPFSCIIVAPNQSNAILIPQHPKSTDAESAIDVESYIELLPKGSRFGEKVKLSIGCCILPSFMRMDTKITKNAKEILHSRNIKRTTINEMQNLETRLSRIELNVERILNVLRNTNNL